MPNSFFNSYVTTNAANSDVVTLAANDTLFVTQFGGLVARGATSNAVQGAGNNRIQISGEAYAASDTAILVNGGANSQINIGVNGSVVSGTVSAVDISGVGASNDVFNAGFIGAGAIGINVDGDHAQITNAGNIHSNGSGIVASNSFAQITNTGTVSANGYAFRLGEGKSLLNNSGTATSSDSTIFVYGSDFGNAVDSNTIINSGTLLSLENACVYFLDPNQDRVINSGAILSEANYGIVAFSSTGETVRIDNSGLISGGESVAIWDGSGNMTVNNRGEIAGIVELGYGDDVYRALGEGFAESVNGGAGQDRLTGSVADDNFDGGAGNDLLDSRAGDDVVSGGSGDDEIDLGKGMDIYLAGNSELLATDDNDDIDGGDGIDTYDARGVTTRVSVNLEELRAAGAAIGVDHVVNFENIRGGSGSDILVGDDGRNVIRGGGDIDFMLGNDGNDRMIGNGGNDSIRGGAGRDVSTGGDGIDTFIYNSISEAGNTTSSRDIITDFVSGTDKINLSVIDANSNAGGNQAFSFIGAGGFTGVAGQLHTVGSATHLVTVVEGDIDGDAKADFQIALFGNLTLAAGDFIL